MKKIHKYQNYILELYNLIGLKCERTPVIIDSIGAIYLSYLHRDNYIEKAPRPSDRKTEAEKRSSWWKITVKGILLLYRVFGYIFKKDDSPIIANKLLTL